MFTVARNALRPARNALRPALAAAPARLLSAGASRAAPGAARVVVGAGALTLAAGAFSMSVVSAAEAAPVDYDALRKDLAGVIEEGGHGPLFIRLSWHSSGTFCKHAKNGGSEKATMRFAPEADHGANAGLDVGRGLLAPLKAKYPGVSFADLWVLAGAVAVEEMGGPAVGFQAGRKDGSAAECTPDGRLPDADKGADPATTQHLRDIFYRMGFDDREIVVLAGAHAVGRCHTDRSGYWGPWTRAETTFSNEYYRELLENTWTKKTKHLGKAWTGPEQYEDPTGDLMMLPSDMVLIKDAKFRPIVEEFAKDEAKFFAEFAAAFQKLNELGTNCPVKGKGWFSWLGL